jgi:uncharacterized protein with ATP-grasp and redox domains
MITFKQDLIKAINAMTKYGVDSEGKCRYSEGCLIGQLIPTQEDRQYADDHAIPAFCVISKLYPEVNATHAEKLQRIHDRHYNNELPFEEFKEKALEYAKQL